jgi:hypothetical protein
MRHARHLPAGKGGVMRHYHRSTMFAVAVFLVCLLLDVCGCGQAGTATSQASATAVLTASF